MSFKNDLLSYFEKTEIPAALEPNKVPSFVRPKAVEKKAVKAVAEQEQPKKAVQNEQKKENARIKSEERSEQKPENLQENAVQQKVGASAFIKIVFHNKLTRNEFLSILGNTKITNRAYREIEENPALTVKELIDILDDSPLTEEDYKKLIIATERTAQLKAEAKEKLKAEESKRGSQDSSIIPQASSKPKVNLNQLTSPKTQEMPPIKEHEPDRSRTNEFNIHGAEAKSDSAYNKPSEPFDADELDEKAENRKKEKSKKKLFFGKRRNDDDEEVSYDSDIDDNDEDDDFDSARKRKKKRNQDYRDSEDFDEDYDEDYDDEYDEQGSNKGKFAAAAVGAVILIGISFGLRYYFTGSVLPKTDNSAQEEDSLWNEDDIFNAISTKSPAALSEYSSLPAYTVGGILEESPLKQIISTEKRLLYISGNSLYIFEQIGGQTDQLDVRNYPADIKLMGLVETEKGIAVISCSEGEPYNFFKTIETVAQESEENGEDVQPQTVSDTVTRPETVVELLNKDAPEKRTDIAKYRLSGTLWDVFSEKGSLIVLTEENIPQNCTNEDYATFMPFILTSEGRKLCTAENTVVSKNAANSSVTAIFALDFENESAVACTAGNLAKAAAVDSGYLYLGAGDCIVQLSVSEGLTEKGRYTVDGSFENFSEIGIDSSSAEQRVRATFKDKNGAALAVFDKELKLVNELKNLGNGEAAEATCYYKDQTYIVTESGTCFGIDGNNNSITESAVKIVSTPAYPFSDSQNNPMGIKITPMDENGKRIALTVSTVKLDGTHEELNSTLISSKTVAKNAMDEYLSSPAESNICSIGSKAPTDSINGIAVIPVVYFDGVSEVELFVIYTVTPEGILSVNGTAVHYDSYSKNIFAVVKGDYVIAITDNRVITVKSENGNVSSYYDISPDDSEYRY